MAGGIPMAHVEVQTHKLDHAHVLLVTLGHGWVAGTIVAWKSIQLFASVSFANPASGLALSLKASDLGAPLGTMLLALAPATCPMPTLTTIQ